MSRHWYKPTFWRWWWATKAPTGAKLFAAIVVSAGVVFAGYELTGVFSQANAAQVYTYVQTIRKVRSERVMQPPVTIREHGRVVTVKPASLTVMGPVRQELVTVTTSQDRVVTIAGEASTVDLARTVTSVQTAAVTRTATVARAYTVTVGRGQTSTVVRQQTVTLQQTAPGQTVSAERTVTQTTPPVTTTVTKTTTASSTTTVERPTTQTVVVTTTTNTPVTTTVTHTVTSVSTVTQTLPVTITIKTTT